MRLLSYLVKEHRTTRLIPFDSCLLKIRNLPQIIAIVLLSYIISEPSSF